MKQQSFFKTKMVPSKDGSGRLFDEEMVSNATPVTYLGKSFPDDEARRAYFTELLAKKLRDPEFRKIEGFPIGSDEDILKLSDPPYYTACPNPWIADFIAEWEAQKPEKPEDFTYHCEPFAADVSEGKNDPIYNAHSYHTKVPHKAIMRYILHYTEPGDIVYDGFCGRGMTGVAAQLCGDRAVIESLGYKVQDDNTILQEETDENGKKTWLAFSKLGVRRVVLNDLSPVATFIASNYNKPIDVIAFEREAKRILQEVEEECGWMYETHHSDSAIRGTIDNIVWSDVFICPECTGEMIFYDVAVDKKAGTVLDEFPCPHCSISLTKRKMDRAWISKYDTTIQSILRQAKQIPVLINYVVGKKRYQKTPDAFDVRLIQKIEESEIPYWFPVDRMLEGGETRRNDPFGITHVHHFYTKRNLWILSAFRDRCKSAQTLLWFNSQLINISKLNRYRPGVSFPYNPLSGTLYIGSQVSESSVFTAYKNKLNKLITAFKNIESLSIDRGRLFRFERLGLFSPLFRVRSPKKKVMQFYIPIRDSEIRDWNPRKVEQLFALTPKKLRHAYETFATAQKSFDPLADWYELTQFVSVDEQKKLKGDALRAETVRIGANMLRFLYQDLYGEELPKLNELNGSINTHSFESEVRKDPRRYLEFVVNQNGQNSGNLLKKLYNQKTQYDLQKLKLSDILTESMLAPNSRRKVANRPIIKKLERVARLAALNPLPTTYDSWEKNQSSRYLSTKSKHSKK